MNIYETNVAKLKNYFTSKFLKKIKNNFYPYAHNKFVYEHHINPGGYYGMMEGGVAVIRLKIPKT